MTGTLTLDHLTITLGPRRLVALTLSIKAGEVATIMGPSGSGKSTALAAITGTLAAEFTRTGRILLNGKDISEEPTRRRGIGLMFQDPVLFPHLSVGGNLAFALPTHVRGRAARQARIEEALASAGLKGHADRDPATLSGGQKARVALLRTLLAEPSALLLDEPFSRLDADLRAQIRAFTFDRARQAGIPTLLVTHDAEDARAAGGPVLSPLGETLPL
ncbi:ATP-binding cassette domain-containing protein [Rhodobacter sp. HX-7-19]|uniref:ATP-binding cassette domain-containing protein n=1 Tax=Paragemmobacter kunshanensis TaxID=2583234 RepID=A0A6M1TWQ4_9RHOB|nr:ATP-binding cassette domain-containing protein [Rhodobacter kunshanensis]NGQ92778.1 ATP-binding cassette domain-containing protein [Rhodobacter kunshanensis]